MAAPLFINDLCFPIHGSDEAIYASILSALKGLRRARELAGSIEIGAAVPLSEVMVTSDYRTLASLTRVMDVEWWRFLRLVDQYSPFSAVPRTTAPTDHSVQSPPLDAALWAVTNGAFVLSFVSEAQWTKEEFDAEICTCEVGDHAVKRSVKIKNISSVQHAEHWRGDLETYGEQRARSTEIYAGPDFSLRMYLGDHPPPHVHVFLPSEPLRCVGKVRFDIEPEYLEVDGLKGRLRSEVLRFVVDKREQLSRSWERCEGGDHPNVLL